MSVLYKIYQMKRTYQDNRQDPANNKFFAKAVHLGTVHTDDLAAIIQQNCSMKKSDVQAVLTELVEVMTDKLQNSYAVKLDGFGTFKIGFRSYGSVDEAGFSVAEHIHGARVNFLPASTIDITSGKRTKALLGGLRPQKRPEDPKKAQTPGGSL